ncbi:hypothetical protein MA16_Dca010677 [Dendrobium catenatum]|uniref:Uncharacterized protein n=1 Tax=Dendrobium catenatum TaxID=906689 RepID=A0A2I0VK09_9ASPA|nr:hypothetical protein MA16_Dca010677 [Dendrobium catenatum]
MKQEKQQSRSSRLQDELCAFLFVALLFPRTEIPLHRPHCAGGTGEVAAAFAWGADCADAGYLAVVDVEQVDHVHDWFYDDAVGFGDGDAELNEPVGKMKVLGLRK